MTARVIDLAAIRALPVVAPSADSTTRWVPFVEVPVGVLAALTDAVEALEFYADPFTYFGIAMFGDAPHGDFFEDFDEAPPLGEKPGKRARAALAKFGSAQ